MHVQAGGSQLQVESGNVNQNVFQVGGGFQPIGLPKLESSHEIRDGYQEAHKIYDEMRQW